ncbi:MAG: hypothetical protein GY856_13295, partial [bacterium]|nr:hypothetical protein [bacterium]
DLIARGNELVLLLSNGRDDTHLAKLDLGNGELRLGAAVSSAASLNSFGTLADGSAVWAEYVFVATGQADPGSSRIMTMPPSPAEEPREICRHFGLFGSYRGSTGSWALWEGMPGSRLYACHLGAGVVRVLDDLGPLGTRSAEVVEGGVLTIRGKIPLE